MGLGADQLEALAECIALINTGRRPVAGSSAEAGSSFGPSRGRPDGADELADIRGVSAFARRYRVENRSAVRASDVPRLLELRARLDAIVVACETGHEERAIRDLNALLAETGAVPRIVTHDGLTFQHIHVSSATVSSADRIAAHSDGPAELIVAGESSRVPTLPSPSCDVVFVDSQEPVAPVLRYAEPAATAFTSPPTAPPVRQHRLYPRQRLLKRPLVEDGRQQG
jgi:hypothetical protein